MPTSSIVRYLAMVVSRIEGWRVSEREIRKMLVQAMRQHRFAKRRRIDYVLDYHHRLSCGRAPQMAKGPGAMNQQSLGPPD